MLHVRKFSTTAYRMTISLIEVQDRANTRPSRIRAIAIVQPRNYPMDLDNFNVPVSLKYITAYPIVWNVSLEVINDE